ncbi:MAG: hypothetical protein FRX48_01522 [Lasallia pustulata]|uniref:Uncharacterized protein n=1 Tax=Lasallia pustulata TaxID=136370 RepID=A0A5M8Q094_9LECA|nr:MAG: hypothetical protein FRX48_01522 [Lasallia pustulata]
MAHGVRPPQQNRSAAHPVGDAVDSEWVIQIRQAFRNASRSQIKALPLIDIVCAYRTALEDGYAPTTTESIDLGDDDEVSEDKESSDDDEGPQGPWSKLEQCEHDLNYIVAHAMIYLSRTARKAREIKRVIEWKKFTALVNENSSKRDF